MANHDLMQLAVLRVRFRIQEVCQSVQSGAFTLPNCFLKSHKRDLRNGSPVAKIRPDHFLLTQNIFTFAIQQWFLSLWQIAFMLWARWIFIEQISSGASENINIGLSRYGPDSTYMNWRKYFTSILKRANWFSDKKIWCVGLKV